MNRSEYSQILDISYGLDDANKLDIYYPKQLQEHYKVVIHVHGGAFKKGDKQDEQLDCYFKFVEEGFVLVSINYRLSGKALFPANIIDTKRAIRFLRDNASLYKLDVNNFTLVGGSAGGYIVDMVCATAHLNILDDVNHDLRQTSCQVNCGISWFGPTDFIKMDEQIVTNQHGRDDHNDIDSPESLFMGHALPLLNKTYLKSASPLSYVNDKMPPMYLQHGLKDRIVPWQQSKQLYDAMHRVNAIVKLDLLPDNDHGGAGFKSEENLNKIISFALKYVK